jgi:hypothetical protein
MPLLLDVTLHLGSFREEEEEEGKERTMIYLLY